MAVLVALLNEAVRLPICTTNTNLFANEVGTWSDSTDKTSRQNYRVRICNVNFLEGFFLLSLFSHNSITSDRLLKVFLGVQYFPGEVNFVTLSCIYCLYMCVYTYINIYIYTLQFVIHGLFTKNFISYWKRFIRWHLQTLPRFLCDPQFPFSSSLSVSPLAKNTNNLRNVHFLHNQPE